MPRSRIQPDWESFDLDQAPVRGPTPAQWVVFGLVLLVAVTSILLNVGGFAWWSLESQAAVAQLPRVQERKEVVEQTLEDTEAELEAKDAQIDDAQARLAELTDEFDEALGQLEDTEQQRQRLEAHVAELEQPVRELSALSAEELLGRMDGFRIEVRLASDVRRAGVREAVVITQIRETGEAEGLAFRTDAAFKLDIEVSFLEHDPTSGEGALLVQMAVLEDVNVPGTRQRWSASMYEFGAHRRSQRGILSQDTLDMVDTLLQELATELPS